MKTIAIGGFLHESNSFAPSQDVDFSWFARHRDRPPLLRGTEIMEKLADGSFSMTGFLRHMAGRPHRMAPLVWASGGAGGLVGDDAFERIAGELAGRLSLAMPVDAVYLDLHGAMVTPHYQDPEGELLHRVRGIVGAKVPIVVTLDYHANVSPEMAALVDGVVAYRTYPHVDRVATGEAAAGLVERLLDRGRAAGVAIRHLHFLIPLHAQCTLVDPSRSVVAHSLVDAGPVISRCYTAGFPPADVHWCGPSVMVHADSQAQADAACDELVQLAMQCEAGFHAPLLGVADAVRAAVEAAAGGGGPVILADIQDNPGAGGGSDTTGLLAELVVAQAADAVIGLFHDAEAARRAHEAGEGARLRLALGGRCGSPGVAPYHGEFVVERLASGRFRTTGRVAGGNDVQLGPMAVLAIGGVRVVVTSTPMQAFDPAPFRHVGIEPGEVGILCLKSTCHFRADFEALARQVLLVVAPGAFVADPRQCAYRHLRAGVRLSPDTGQR